LNYGRVVACPGDANGGIKQVGQCAGLTMQNQPRAPTVAAGDASIGI
jgi:hypothetical protein